MTGILPQKAYRWWVALQVICATKSILIMASLPPVSQFQPSLMVSSRALIGDTSILFIIGEMPILMRDSLNMKYSMISRHRAGMAILFSCRQY